MREHTVEYKGVELNFLIYEGVIQGYNKLVETTTNISGGGGKVRTSNWTGKVSGSTNPISSTTRHRYIIEFFVVENNGKKLPVKLVNCPHTFRDGQSVSVWVENNKMVKYKIVNHSVGSTTIVNSVRDIVKSTDYYFNQYFKANLPINLVWRSIQLGVLALVIYFIIELIHTKYVGTSLLGMLIIMIPVIIVYRTVKNIIRMTLIKGMKRELLSK